MINRTCIYIFFFLQLTAVLFLSSCKKDDSTVNPPINDIPSIQLKSLTPDTVHNLKDSLLFAITYLDGDGDLGDYDPDTLSLWITDNRFPLTEKFHIIPLTPLGTTIAITGELDVVLDHIPLQDPNAISETATFTVKIKDRAGHWSNSVTSGNIVVLP